MPAHLISDCTPIERAVLVPQNAWYTAPKGYFKTSSCLYLYHGQCTFNTGWVNVPVTNIRSPSIDWVIFDEWRPGHFELPVSLSIQDRPCTWTIIGCWTYLSATFMFNFNSGDICSVIQSCALTLLSAHANGDTLRCTLTVMSAKVAKCLLI